jgi:hypothetical protein
MKKVFKWLLKPQLSFLDIAIIYLIYSLQADDYIKGLTVGIWLIISVTLGVILKNKEG